ncbi:interleukin-4 receptor subunit alpha-like [Phyllostomus hastatus]|uniref:interleukin-4 receptor subunit alpha-like n=1 Tax=Phyllostomus hastatus TaxID=9423 RepID=UPI001E67F114|nr:interleukin-4 receptor subunit alpha-like [Phyllostomus hastatus]XP_045705135.1 interleukin-4 receptor subunit alpha-like [Phyllostomus hastatus]XP_045705136.1 interleukin-4 receptor subunit alpha-like [Phyllostomus hastatus]
MGRLGSGLTFPVSCLVLAWAAGSGSVQVLHRPTCFSDYISTFTCEWRVDSPTNCSAELRLTYQLDFLNSENHACVPENRESTVCLCDVLMDDVVSVDTYQLGLWAGKQLLWNGSFQPSEHVKPRAPVNLTVDADDSHSWWLRWGNPYPPESFLHAELSYQVSVSDEDDPASCTVHDVTYREPTLRLPASTLKPGASYRARVRAWAQSYNSTWSEWSPGVTWLNHHTGSWEQHLQLGVAVACMVILVVCVSCYCSIIKIKEWWDQIPSPALSPLVAAGIQEPQVSLWEKRPGGQEPAKRPHWKTCLTKLLPCLLEHDTERGDSSSKAARKGPSQGPGKPPWCPGAVSTRILSPESVSVVKCVELLEAQVESEEEEEVEQEKGSFCPSPESGGGSFQDSREGIAARLTESLFLDLLGAENGGFCPQGLGESCLPAPSEGGSAQMPGAELPREEPFSPESAPLTQSPACLAFPEMPSVAVVVVADNPFYRSFSDFLSQSSGAGELASDTQLSERLGGGDPNILSAPQPSEPPAALQPEPETWEQVLRQSVLQHRATAAPAVAAPSGYREFVCAVKQGSALGGGSSGCSPSGAAGYKAFSSLLTSGATCPGTPGVEASSGEGCYRPCQSLTAGPPGVPAPDPLFTFGLDMEPPHSSQDSLLPSSCPNGPCVEPVAKGEDHQKPLLSLELTTDPLGDDLGSGIVYSALTCHLCGHLKRCDSQEEHGQAQVVSSPCCGCHCGDRSEPPVSPLRDPDPLPGGVPPEGKPSLFFQPGPGKAQSPSQSPQVVVVPPAGPTCTSAS